MVGMCPVLYKPVVAIMLESNLQLYSEEEQHYVGHSERGMYAVLLQCSVIRCFAVCHVPSYDASYAKVSNLQAVADTRWRSMAGRTVKCGKRC
ncbi:hypothetical protein TIFTF001_026033 [Ficus carica]|uniref:Uncharacterized protein n=1 Tax=Ficus carica TaxID=3494 RepID=A0AA88ANX3_FICCA|nr:hypothetical protein TIFTF001_026033 [Ficus carica]